MDRPVTSGNRRAAVIEDFKVYYQTLRLRTPRERTSAECVSEGVPAGRRDLDGHPAPCRRVADRVRWIGAGISWKRTRPRRIRACVHPKARHKVSWQFGSRV